MLRQHLQPQDLIARLGGEEFFALIDERDAAPEGAVGAAERLRLAVAMHPWSTLADGLKVTVSIGVARPHEAGSNAVPLPVTDRRLDAAKTGGAQPLRRARLSPPLAAARRPP